MLAPVTTVIVSVFLLLASWPTLAQQVGTVLAVENSGAFACRTSRAARLKGNDVAAAIANGTCIPVPRGQAVRILQRDPNPQESSKGDFFTELLRSPHRVELVGNSASGDWYIAPDAIGSVEHMTKQLSQLAKEFEATKKQADAAKARPPSTHRPRGELIPIAQHYLEIAGITDYKFLPPMGTDEVELAWEYADGSRASLSITRPEAKISVTVVLGHLILRDTAYCKGQYSSGYMPARYHLGSEIRKAYTACSDGSRSFALYYSVSALPSGAILRLGASAAQSGLTPEAVPRAELLENAALKAATTRR